MPAERLRQAPFGGKAIILAWAIEVVAVGMGLVLAASAGIEGSSGGPLGLFIAMLPFIALTATELTKIPLVALAFSVGNPIWKLVAVAALAVVTFATFEQFLFGFERGFAERLSQVTEAGLVAQTAAGARDRAQTLIPELQLRQTEITQRLTTLREEIEAIRAQAQADIRDTRESSTAASEFQAERERIERDLATLERNRIADVDRERRRCSVPDVRCNTAAIEANYRNQRAELQRRLQAASSQASAIRERAEGTANAARARRDAEIDAKSSERAALQAALDTTRLELAEAQVSYHRSAETAEQALRRRDELIQRSQMHRLAATLHGSTDQEAVDAIKKLFVTSLAAIVALIGTLIAALHYAAMRSASRRAGPLTNAFRGYLARRRRRMPITVARIRRMGATEKLFRAIRLHLATRRRGEVVREVEVPVERLKLVYLPLDASEAELAELRRQHGHAALPVSSTKASPSKVTA